VSSLPIEATTGEHEITVRIEAERVSASDAASLIRAFDKAFTAYARARGRGTLRLTVARAGSGSFWATLSLMTQTYEMANDHKDIIAMFMHDFGAIVSSIEQGLTKNAPRHLLALAKSIGQVGKRTAADFVEVIGIVRVIIQSDLFELMSTSAPNDDSGEDIGFKVQRRGNSVLVDRRALVEAAEKATEGALFATLLHVEDDWYARAEGMHVRRRFSFG
jgi:hypothetical protein